MSGDNRMELELTDQLVVLGQAGNLDADETRDVLAGIGRDHPDEARRIGQHLMRVALHMIGGGQAKNPARLAKSVLTITDGWWTE